jgi:hypothetical protein
MKSGSGSGRGGACAPSAGGGSSLAIAERQKPAPSCVAALFQMFARRKLFSSSSKKSKLLPPGEIATKLHCSCSANLLLFVSFSFLRCFSARNQVLAWETGGRRRQDGGRGQDEAPFGQPQISSLFFFIRFFLGDGTAVLLWSSSSETVMKCL